MRGIVIIILIIVIASSIYAQDKGYKKHWFEKIEIGGYMQVRYNNLFQTNPKLECEQCDENWGGESNGISLRRVRLTLKGQISPRVFFYLQPDFAKSISETHHVGRLKDAYIDVGLDVKNEFRIRLGQSKVPFGFDNMQSSSKRLPLDRSDAINSAVKDERDLGFFFYWAPKEKRELIKKLAKSGLSGGDFGLFAIGLYNGQTANRLDENNTFHIVSRVTYPIVWRNQVIEACIQAYSGKYVVNNHSAKMLINDGGYTDQRMAFTFVLYPKPFGIQAEYITGKGPEYDLSTASIQIKPLKGGYTTFSYFIEKWKQEMFCFMRLQYYKGGKKHEMDARSYTIHDVEIGVEWHPFPNFELLCEYTLSDRNYVDNIQPLNHQKGSVVRMQAQVAF